MKNPDSKAILSIAMMVLWRVAVVAAAVALLVFAATHFVLQTIFNGPSVAARNTLALTLLSDPDTADIPARYMGQNAVDALLASACSTLGTTDPALITPTASGPSQTQTLTLERCTAQVMLTANRADFAVAGMDTPCGYACFRDGILIISDDISAMPNDGVIFTGAVLMVNGKANEALLQASGLCAFTAVGQASDGTFIYVTTDGSSYETPGATYRDLLNIMTEYGAVNACVIACK